MGVIFAVLTATCWAAYNVAVRRGRDSMHPGAGYMVTLIINAAATGAFTLLPLPGAGAPGRSLWPFLYFVLAGLSTTLLGRWLYFESVFTVGPSRASAWKNVSPVYTLVVAWLALGERPSLLTVVGVLATAAGMLALARDQMGLEEQGRLSRAGGGATVAAAPGRAGRLGLLLGVGSGVAFASGIMLRKAGLNAWPDPAVGTAIGAWAALLGWLPVALWRGEIRQLRGGDRRGLWYFFLAGLFSSAAQLLVFLSLRLSPSAVTHAVTSLEPVLTVLLSRWLLGGQEPVTPGLVRAVLVTTFGVVLVTLH